MVPHIWIHMCVCLYVYICMCLFIHTYMCAYTVFVCSLAFLPDAKDFSASPCCGVTVAVIFARGSSDCWQKSMWENERRHQKRGGPPGGRGHVWKGPRKDAAPISTTEGILHPQSEFQPQRGFLGGAKEASTEMKEVLVVRVHKELIPSIKWPPTNAVMPGEETSWHLASPLHHQSMLVSGSLWGYDFRSAATPPPLHTPHPPPLALSSLLGDQWNSGDPWALDIH